MKTFARAFIVARIGSLDVHRSDGRKPFARLRLAVTDRWTDGDGNTREQTSWFTAVAFGKVVDALEKHLDQGDAIAADARLRCRQSEEHGEQVELVLGDWSALKAAPSEAGTDDDGGAEAADIE